MELLSPSKTTNHHKKKLNNYAFSSKEYFKLFNVIDKLQNKLEGLKQFLK